MDILNKVISTFFLLCNHKLIVIMANATMSICFDTIKKIFLKRRKAGVTAVEAAFVLPPVLVMIFFSIELWRVQIVKNALDGIAMECALDFIASKSTANFEKTINKHLKIPFSRDSITYYFEVYKDLAAMCSKAPYGATDPQWSNTMFIDNDGNGSLTRPDTSTSISLVNSKNPLSTPSINSADAISGKAFVLTFVCKFSFSSAFVAKLFGGGANTKDKNAFLVWGRAAGICE